MPVRLTVHACGAGVQSTAILLLVADGWLPKPDVAIFADTQWEPPEVYTHLDRLEADVLHPLGIPLHRVSRGNLRQDMMDPSQRYASVPYYIRGTDGSEGIGRRQCTSEYKLSPIRRRVRELLGAAPPDFRRVPKGRLCEQWVGFSTDEIGRVSSEKYTPSYLRTSYPLLDLGLSRKDCERINRRHGYGDVPKSACVGCPYTSNIRWRDLRDNKPEQWAEAVAFDAAVRHGGSRASPLRGEAFLHRSRVPLALANIDHITRGERASWQLDLLDVVAEEEPPGCSPFGCRSEEGR